VQPLIIANWKMNPATVKAAARLARDIEHGIATLRGAEAVIAPPFPFLAAVGGALRRGRLGAQDVAAAGGGPYTGEVSAAMLRDFGVRYVMIGHSERRRLFGESNELINSKVRQALRSGLRPVIAVGEELRESQAVVPSAIAEELFRAIAGIPRRSLAQAVIAYEPVWAISTTPGARPDTPDNAARRAIYIRKLLTRHLGARVADSIRVIYGGSVSIANAAGFVSRDIRGMEGLLVGGASLNAKEFVAIVQAVSSSWRRR